MKANRIKITEIFSALKHLPKTISIMIKVDRKAFILILGVSAITGIFPVITLVLSQELINSFVRRDASLNLTIKLFLLYIIASFISELVAEAKGYIEGKFQYLLQYRLNFMIMNKCTKLTLEDFESSEIYDKVEKITSEIAYRPYQILLAIINSLTGGVTMVSSVALLMAWNPYIGILLLIIPVISLLYFLKIGQQEFDVIWNRAKDERKTWYLSYLLTHDFSFKEITVLDIKNYILTDYLKLSKKFITQNIKILKKKTIFNVIYEIIMQLISSIIIGSAIISAYTGKILVGNVMSYIRSVGLVQNNSQAIMGNIYTIYNCSLYMDMLFQFFNYREMDDKPELNRLQEEIKKIDISNLSFSYKNGKRALKDVSFSLKKGEKVALVGPNGSGKSTLIKILSGLYSYKNGKILINNISLDSIDIKDYHSKISILFQDFVKYELTLKENIGFGNVKNIEADAKIEKILDKLQADFLKADGKYNLKMQLGNWFENGRQLSQGQWQKVALSRVYFRDASLYILDEPNAALDTVSEREIFDSFFNISDGKIGVFISHRLNAAKMADKIIVMDHGEVAGIGKHEELLVNCPVYQKLYQAELYGKE